MTTPLTPWQKVTAAELKNTLEVYEQLPTDVEPSTRLIAAALINFRRARPLHALNR